MYVTHKKLLDPKFPLNNAPGITTTMTKNRAEKKENLDFS